MYKYLRLLPLLQLSVSWMIIEQCMAISSPLPLFMNYKHSIELQADVADLHWTVNDDKQEIIFELHVKSTGWIALGISPGKKIFVWFMFSTNNYFKFSWWYERCRHCCWMD